MDDVLDYFRRLGDQVDQSWSAQGRRTQQLAEIAATSLRDIPVPECLTPEVILGLLAEGAALPKQRESSDQFGQPPAVMYRSSDFEIQAITWMAGTTSTHQHGFDGAFRVASGSSLHVRYSFEQHETWADGHLVTGDLSMIDQEILWTGDVRPIYSGPEFIHALFHLESPSMTIVVRNGSSRLPFPQYDYRLPGLGFDALDKDDPFRMRMRGLHSLYRLDADRGTNLARDIVSTQDLWTAFRVCDEWALAYGETTELLGLVEVLARRAEVFGELLPPMYMEELRRRRLLLRRGMLRQSRHRMFMALVVNLPDRTSIYRSLEELFPDENPSRVIGDLITELASPEYRGISGLNIGAEELATLNSQLDKGLADDALSAVAARWNPPSVLESFFTKT